MFEENLNRGSSFLISASNSADSAGASYYMGWFGALVVNLVAIFAYIAIFLIILRTVLRFVGYILSSFGFQNEKLQKFSGGKSYTTWGAYLRGEAIDIVVTMLLAFLFFTGAYGTIIAGGVNLAGRALDSLTDANITGIVRTGDEFKTKIQNYEYDESVRLYNMTSEKMKEKYESLKNKSNIDSKSNKVQQTRNDYARYFAESELLSQHIIQNFGSDLQQRGKTEEDFKKHKKRGVDGETQYIPTMFQGSEAVLDQYGVSVTPG